MLAEDCYEEEFENSPEASLTPAEIVRRLDEYIISQHDAKRAVAIALRNRWRRMRVSDDFRDEISPKNIIMIGPTGVGKTEISRRLAKFSGAPFVKVEASKFTEVGYVGRDVEAIIRDLVEIAMNVVREEQRNRVASKAEEEAEERLLDLLLPGSAPGPENDDAPVEGIGFVIPTEVPKESKTREKLRELLRAGKLDDRQVDVQVTKHASAHMQVLGPQGFAEIEGQIKDMLSNMVPPQSESKRMKVPEARKVLSSEAQDRLIDNDDVVEKALSRAEQAGIVFIDEIDKVCGGTQNSKGPDVSREGVQRDLLPLVEGCTVSTKYGPVSTEHILFIASGAFHVSKPSDLMPEFQGRFPIRVELKSLNAEDFVRILVEPRNALTKQYRELLATEGVQLEFADDAIDEISKITVEVNTRSENIGARRLHTVLEKLLEQLSFSAQEHQGEKIVIDRQYVQDQLAEIVRDSDLSKYIL